mmetsp:Transcript_41171/g.69210  ORF Transcript_41171/g.69210 Transcript_41171/m.69210 type:complete len:116 (+) Transcript_41171:333-680(+)
MMLQKCGADTTWLAKRKAFTQHTPPAPQQSMLCFTQCWRSAERPPATTSDYQSGNAIQQRTPDEKRPAALDCTSVGLQMSLIQLIFTPSKRAPWADDAFYRVSCCSVWLCSAVVF